MTADQQPPPRAKSGRRDGWRSALEPWKVKERVATPLFVNLSTALIIGATTYWLAPSFGERFRRPGVEGYPVYCVSEAYNENVPGSWNVIVDAYLVNMADDSRNIAQLDSLVKKKDPRLKPTIVFRLASDRITSVSPDSALNAGNEVDITLSKDSSSFEVVPMRIMPRKVLRFVVRTSARRPITGHTAFGGNPMTCQSEFRGL